MGIGRRGVIFEKEGRGWRLPGFLYGDNLVLCGESEEDLGLMVGRRRGLKVNASKSKVVVLVGEEGLEYEVFVNGICLEHTCLKI